MGQGIDLAKAENPKGAKLLDDMKDQLLIALIKRAGNKITVPVSEVDDTYQDILYMGVEENNAMKGAPTFIFEVRKKS